MFRKRNKTTISLKQKKKKEKKKKKKAGYVLPFRDYSYIVQCLSSVPNGHRWCACLVITCVSCFLFLYCENTF